MLAGKEYGNGSSKLSVTLPKATLEKETKRKNCVLPQKTQEDLARENNISGHQRVRACKELGIRSVMCDVHTYNNDDEILQDLLETNIRQRGDVGGSAKKVGMRIKELERIYGIKVGNPNYENNSQLKTQSQLASYMGLDVRTLQNYKTLADMIPELDELEKTGIVTKSTALAIMKQLSESDFGECTSTTSLLFRELQLQKRIYH